MSTITNQSEALTNSEVARALRRTILDLNDELGNSLGRNHATGGIHPKEYTTAILDLTHAVVQLELHADLGGHGGC